MIYVLSIALIFFSIYYLYNIIYFIYGLIRIKKIPQRNNNKPVSIIVPVYNGEKSLKRLLGQLSKQIYHSDIEFIIVDDMSTDQSKNIIENFIEVDNRFIYVSSSKGSKALTYKKRALDAGIKKSKYSILLFTDVDCQVGNNWATSMVNEFNDDIDYVVGFSYADNKYVNNYVSKFQQIDFFMLMISAFSCINNNKPWACTGQNQAYRKKMFQSVGGFNLIEEYIQGDDTLFMQICKNNNKKISFCLHPDSYVITRNEYKLISFLKQRIRWSGDANIMWKFNKNLFMMILSTFLINSSILYLLFFVSIRFTILYLLVKILLEFILFQIGRQKFVDIKISNYALWSILQIPYIFLMGCTSFIANQLIVWRDRRI